MDGKVSSFSLSLKKKILTPQQAGRLGVQVVQLHRPGLGVRVLGVGAGRSVAFVIVVALAGGGGRTSRRGSISSGLRVGWAGRAGLPSSLSLRRAHAPPTG